MTYPCEITDQAAQPILTIRTRTSIQDIAQALGQAYGEIFGYLGEQGVQPAGMPFTMYYNMDMSDLDIEIGVAVERPVPEKSAMRLGELPAGKIAACLYTGPYSDCGPAYEELQRFVQEQGYEAAGVAIEYYFSGPDVPPEETQTRIVFPLKSPEKIVG
jgi:effector-binding domain-containing protein